TAKRLEILRELLPAAKRVALLVNPTGPNAETTIRDVGPAASAIGLDVRIIKASTSREISTSVRDARARAARCPGRRSRSLPGQPAVATGPPGGASRNSGMICGSGFRRDRRVDQLRFKPHGCISPARCLHRPRPQGRQPRRIAGPWLKPPLT